MELNVITRIFCEYHECYMHILHKCKWETEKNTSHIIENTWLVF